MSHKEIRIVLVNKLSEIEKLRPKLENFGQECGLSPKTLAELNLILEEIVANIISYAYADSRSHEIVLQIILRGSELILEVEDDGQPFNPLQIPPPDLESPLERRKVGGLGLYLVREYTVGIEYHRKEEKNCLVIRKEIGKSRESAG